MRKSIVCVCLCFLMFLVNINAQFNFFSKPELKIHRLVNELDHLYISDNVSKDKVLKDDTYESEGVAGLVFSKQVKDSVPLYHFYNKMNLDNGLAAIPERIKAFEDAGYVKMEIVGYVYIKSKKNIFPLYEFIINKNDMLYTTSADEVNSILTNDSYSYVGIACYVATENNHFENAINEPKFLARAPYNTKNPYYTNGYQAIDETFSNWFIPDGNRWSLTKSGIMLTGNGSKDRATMWTNSVYDDFTITFQMIQTKGKNDTRGFYFSSPDGNIFNSYAFGIAGSNQGEGGNFWLIRFQPDKKEEWITSWKECKAYKNTVNSINEYKIEKIKNDVSISVNEVSVVKFKVESNSTGRFGFYAEDGVFKNSFVINKLEIRQ